VYGTRIIRTAVQENQERNSWKRERPSIASTISISLICDAGLPRKNPPELPFFLSQRFSSEQDFEGFLETNSFGMFNFLRFHPQMQILYLLWLTDTVQPEAILTFF